eukprot:CAMPEP_0180269156 /NCGR_PEP_ID=MMETSP0988-20121125/2496_1 /TAXON_ID=697907 /ORGANISM="non described non described, Strain CCMP2293" /LENGTH=99 /DNA_ID=CAMNT_0022240011 /DNA_START=282 /DNA_END=581 /DNA_ORIENTATION=+
MDVSSWAEETDAPTAKRPKLAPAAAMPAQDLLRELEHRGLKSEGSWHKMEARLEADRGKSEGCSCESRGAGRAPEGVRVGAGEVPQHSLPGVTAAEGPG